ncbi:hypothetical protein OV208_11950 [Corallococcus sp. bb12-1]|uniref:Uncharacterized protein n=1 Tax=Corallococcus terminator TaxID=2316733 RepID=A0A3A8IDI0_9BACT|nr:MULTISPECIES: hypothetical protein [Corallococcus]MCY1042030.1 hypothetical protein [Corallococcus sp. bb12-1]RKG81537.1 hypothetical protein D7V88_26205 [Corallococcus terminator]
MGDGPLGISCEWQQTIQQRPQKNVPVGYLLDIKGMGKDDGSFPKSTSLFYTPFEGEPAYGEVKLEAVGAKKAVRCVGLITHLHWEGGKLDPIDFVALISPENKPDFTGITNTELKKLTFWICEWDSAAGKWYEKCYPLGDEGGTANALVGRLNQQGSEVNFKVSEPEAVSANTDIKFCQLTFQVIPDKQNLCNFHYGHNSAANDVYGWGFKEGTK